MTDSTLLRFGRCEVHLPQREVRLDGQVQVLAPKAYELLVMLVQQRHRVVEKRELIEALWLRRTVSDSVLARTVMQARRAIGDPAARPEWIKTLHGVGYRFAGEVFESTAHARPAPAAARPAAGAGPAQRRIGVLPCDNQTDDPSLDWTQLGLMALVGHGLERDARLTVMPMSTMLDAVAKLPPNALPEERAQFAIDVLGLRHAVHAVIRRQSGALWLEYRVFGGAGEPVLTGSLRDDAPVALGERFAQTIDDALFPGAASAVAFESEDAFVNQAFARAVELYHQEQWRSAAHLLAMISEIEPHSTAVAVWHLSVMVLLSDPTALVAAKALIARAQTLGDVQLEARAHHALGAALVFHMVEGSVDDGRHHLEQALRLSEGQGDAEWAITILLHAAMEAQRSGRTERASQLYERAETSCRAHGAVRWLALLQHNFGDLQRQVGNLIGAKHRLGDAVRLAGRAHMDVASMLALADLAGVNAQLGLFDLAKSQSEEVLCMLDRPSNALPVTGAAAVIVLTLAQCGALNAMERVLGKTARFASDRRTAVVAQTAIVQASVALGRGDAAQARLSATEAVSLAAMSSNVEVERFALPLMLCVETLAADVQAAARVRTAMAALPGFASDPGLRGAVLHSEAAEQLGRGEADAALTTLTTMVEQLPVGRAYSCARLDAAWLHLEAGDTARAEQLLAGAGTWRHDHPAGLATEARLRFAQKRYAEAADAQQRSLERFETVPPSWHYSLLQSYAAAERGEAVTPMRLPRLVSDSWLPEVHGL